jgi:NtrC-family two-component system response regulator AlgB
MDFLVIDDEKTFRDATCFLIEEVDHYAEGVSSGEQGLVRLKEDKFDAVLLDLNLGKENGLDILEKIQKANPNVPVVMFTGQGSVKVAVEAMRRGAVDFLEKPFTREQFLTVLARLQRLQQMGRRIEDLQEEVKEMKAQGPEALFDFSAPAMRDTMEIVMRAAKSPASILILGESGTGKSVLARTIHQRSHLADKPFVTVSCPSLSKELLQSDLFGHVKGAFTGAIKDTWGKVKAASGGTLFLDEIGDLPMEIQPKLLRLLQEREYERVGENVTRTADVRIIAATNRDLKKRIAEGAFREDLFFRLNVIAVDLPALRARPGDLLCFAEHYAKHFAAQCARNIQGFTDEAKAKILAYPWPGNLRELRNAVERAVILARKELIVPEDLPLELRGDVPVVGQTATSATPAGLGQKISLDKLEEMHIRDVLQCTDSLVEAAEVLGINRATLYRKCKRLGLSSGNATAQA